jgi:hypothetical protein
MTLVNFLRLCWLLSLSCVLPLQAQVAAGTINVSHTVYYSDGAVHKSTDGGQTWTSVLAGGYDILVMDPQGSTTLYAGCIGWLSVSCDGIVKSTDAGASWKSIGSALGPVSFLSPSMQTIREPYMPRPGVGSLRSRRMYNSSGRRMPNRPNTTCPKLYPFLKDKLAPLKPTNLPEKVPFWVGKLVRKENWLRKEKARILSGIALDFRAADFPGRYSKRTQ